jgi:hypothetical protein
MVCYYHICIWTICLCYSQWCIYLVFLQLWAKLDRSYLSPKVYYYFIIFTIIILYYYHLYNIYIFIYKFILIIDINIIKYL